MKYKVLLSSIAGPLCVFAMLGTCDASVIGANPGIDYAHAPTTVDFGMSGQASYTFSRFLNNPSVGAAGGVAPGVSTAGTARVSSSPIVSNAAATYTSGATLSSNQIFGGPYDAFPNKARANTTSQFPFIGLRFTLVDGMHFGYAQIDNLTLSRIAYESTPGAAITTGQAIDKLLPPTAVNTTVPAPPSWAIFGIGGLMLSISARQKHRHSRAKRLPSV